VAIEDVRKRRRQAVQAILQIGSFLDERCGYHLHGAGIRKPSQ
jgi:hypothetical protein